MRLVRRIFSSCILFEPLVGHCASAQEKVRSFLCMGGGLSRHWGARQEFSDKDSHLLISEEREFGSKRTGPRHRLNRRNALPSAARFLPPSER